MPSKRFFFRVMQGRGYRELINYMLRIGLSQQIARQTLSTNVRQGFSTAYLDNYYWSRYRSGNVAHWESVKSQSKAQQQVFVNNCVSNPAIAYCENLKGVARSKWLEAKMRAEREPINEGQDEKIRQLQAGEGTADRALERADSAQAAALAAQRRADQAYNRAGSSGSSSGGSTVPTNCQHGVEYRQGSGWVCSSDTP